MVERELHATLLRLLICAEQPRDSLSFGPCVGQVEMFFEDLSKPHGGKPTGWLEADGRWYWRGEYPDLAGVCRRYTHWFRWHVLRQFRVPDLRGQVQVGVDFGATVRPDYEDKTKRPPRPFGDVHDDPHNRPPPSRWDS